MSPNTQNRESGGFHPWWGDAFLQKRRDLLGFAVLSSCHFRAHWALLIENTLRRAVHYGVQYLNSLPRDHWGIQIFTHLCSPHTVGIPRFRWNLFHIHLRESLPFPACHGALVAFLSIRCISTTTCRIVPVFWYTYIIPRVLFWALI